MEEAPAWILVVFTALYFGQLSIAIRRGTNEKTPTREGGVRPPLFQCMGGFDEGPHNLWVFVLLAFVFPVFLTSLVNIYPLFQTQEQANVFRANFFYYLCVSCVCVLMTLEFSYLHTLRNSARGWSAMMLAALVLDLMTLLVLLFLVRTPMDWEQSPPTDWTQAAFCVATVAAVISSLFILILSRVAGAVFDGQVTLQEAEGAKEG